MIRVIIELLDGRVGGNYVKPVTIASAIIWNDGTGDLEVGNYKYILYDSKTKDYQVKLKKWRSGGIKGFLRQQKNIWELLFVMLRKIIAGKTSRQQ